MSSSTNDDAGCMSMKSVAGTAGGCRWWSLCGADALRVARWQPTNDLPNPYRSVAPWGNLPDGRKWGALNGVDIDRDGVSVWVADRCGANPDTPPGANPVPVRQLRRLEVGSRAQVRRLGQAREELRRRHVRLPAQDLRRSRRQRVGSGRARRKRARAQAVRRYRRPRPHRHQVQSRGQGAAHDRQARGRRRPARCVERAEQHRHGAERRPLHHRRPFRAGSQRAAGNRGAGFRGSRGTESS